MIGKPEFIGIWLTLKVAGRIWGRRENENKGKDSYIYQVFLIGSALSLTYAVIGAKSVIWYQSTNYCFAFAMPIALIFATVILLFYIKKIN